MKKLLLVLSLTPITFAIIYSRIQAQQTAVYNRLLPDSIFSEIYRLSYGENTFCDYTVTHTSETYELYCREEMTVTRLIYNVDSTKEIVLTKVITRHEQLPAVFTDFNYTTYPAFFIETLETNMKEKDNYDIVKEMIYNRLNDDLHLKRRRISRI